MKSSQIYSTRKPEARIYAVLCALLLASALLSICIGAVGVSPIDVLRVLTGQLSGTAEANIILLARLPRTCGSLFAGAALAVSGAVIQSVLTNPLAAPNMIGVNSGAGMAVALCSALFPTASRLMPLVAFLGAFLGVLLVLFIAERTGASKLTLVLAGVAVSSVFGAIIDAIVSFVPDALNAYSDFRIGGFSNLPMSRIIPAFWVIVLSLLVIFTLTNELDVLMLGTDTAQSLGLRAGALRLLLLALAAALAGAAVSFSGLLGFVGLIVPHIMRRLIGESSRGLLTACALGGASMLTLCDLLSRVVFAPYELPVGIVLSVIGGPFFILLLLRQRKGRSHD